MYGDTLWGGCGVAVFRDLRSVVSHADQEGERIFKVFA
jgi:hypothetical protein